jgi:hypothetical protein
MRYRKENSAELARSNSSIASSLLENRDGIAVARAAIAICRHETTRLNGAARRRAQSDVSYGFSCQNGSKLAPIPREAAYAKQ